MRLALKYYPTLTPKGLQIVEELSFHTTKLYNIANYQCREEGWISYVELERQLRGNWHRDHLHSHTYQQCLKLLDQDWRSYFRSREDYKKNPHKYLGVPHPPRYKGATCKNQILFTNFALRLKGRVLKLSLSKTMQQTHCLPSLDVTLPPWVLQQLGGNNMQQACFSWDKVQRRWMLRIIYKQEEKVLPKSWNNVMSIDLGLDNLCAITFRHSMEQVLINGKTLKAKNAYYNQQIRRLTALEMKQTGAAHYQTTKKIRRLYQKRHNYLHDALHKVSRKVVDLACSHGCHTIVVGDLKGIKQHSPIKGFVQIPIQRLVEMIKYKAALVGMDVVLVKEAYTSGVSAYDLEPVEKSSYDKSRRIQRGLFQTQDQQLVSSDINGSLNILRIYDKHVVPMPIQGWRDNGCLNHPARITVA
jgi:IS605 OrfB family transposase